MTNIRSLYEKHRSSLIALLSGAILPLSFNPVSLWPAGILAMFGLSYALAGSTARQSAWLGWLFGIGMFGSGTSWIYISFSTYSDMGTFFAVLVTMGFACAMSALFIVLFTWPLQRFFASKENSTASPLAFASLWLIAEWCRTWILTGFPWLFLGYAHLHSPLSTIAPVFGVMGISFVVALTGSSLHLVTNKIMQSGLNRKIALSSLLPLAICWGLAFILMVIDVKWVEPTGETLSVAVVHGTIPQEDKFNSRLDLEIVDRFAEQTEIVWGHDVILWPETAIPMYYHRAGAVMDYLSTTANNNGSTLITGIFYRTEDEKIHNSIVSLGNGDGLYHKQRLVPMGEYVPFLSIIGPIFQMFDLPMSTISPGPKNQNLLSAGTQSVAPFVCYEIVYPELVRKAASTSDLLVTISNDTWFGDSWGPRQHMEMAAMRALENGRYLLRSTNNGISAIVDEKGNILAQSTQFDAQVLSAQAKVFSGHTPFTVWGIWPLLLGAVIVLVGTLRKI